MKSNLVHLKYKDNNLDGLLYVFFLKILRMRDLFMVVIFWFFGNLRWCAIYGSQNGKN